MIKNILYIFVISVSLQLAYPAEWLGYPDAEEVGVGSGKVIVVVIIDNSLLLIR